MCPDKPVLVRLRRILQARRAFRSGPWLGFTELLGYGLLSSPDFVTRAASQMTGPGKHFSEAESEHN